MTCEELWPKFDQWAELMEPADAEKARGEFGMAYRTIRQAIMKSCLLDRMVHGGESPSQTPCPVHGGQWSGCHVGWPGQTFGNGTPLEESSQLRKWFDAGCRCYQHSCGCTTGWQPDVHCGCVKP